MAVTQEGLGKELVCVLFPGNVKNEDKAIKCLGGIKAISQICGLPSKKPLTLSFQPDNPYVKKVNGEVKNTSGVLLRVKVRKTKQNGTTKSEVLNTSVLGHVKKIHKFESLCDFQYLPISNPPKPECLLDKIIPSGLDDLNFLEEPSPLYVVPGSFVRFDKPIQYFYTDKKTVVQKDDDIPLNTSGKDDVHKMRSERGVPIPKYVFNLVDELPTEPHNYFLELKNSKASVNPQIEKEFQIVKKMYDERPVWSLNHIKHHTKIKSANLKIILPCLALYNRNGPWRMLWVKLGYDPRKNPKARYYQTLDFRLRHAVGVFSSIAQDQSGVRKDRTKRFLTVDGEEIITEDSLYFKPESMPSQRQIFYMYCDVQLPEVQEILAAEPPTGYLCHLQRGWLPADTAETVRDIMFKYLKKNVMDYKHLKLEQASSGDDETDEDETNTPDVSMAQLEDSLPAT